MKRLLTVLQYVGSRHDKCYGTPLTILRIHQKIPGNSRRRLTTPGKITLGIVCLGIIASLASTILKDINKSTERMRAEKGKQNLLSELRLNSETFTTFAVQLTFDEQIDWRNTDFLSKIHYENLTGEWKKKTGIRLADWRLTKQKGQENSYERNSVLFVEKRGNEIEEFVKQNPEFDGLSPEELTFWGSLKSLKDYDPPSALYLYSDKSTQVEDTGFDIEASPQERIFYEAQRENKGLVLTASFELPYSDIVDSTISLMLYFSAPTETKIFGDKIIEKSTAFRPVFTDHLLGIDILVNGRRVYRAFDRMKDAIKVIPNSPLSRIDDRFRIDLISNLQLSRAIMAENYSFEN